MYSKKANQIVPLRNKTFFISNGELFGCGEIPPRVFRMKNVQGNPVKLTVPGLENESIEAIYCIGTDSDFRLLIQTKEDEIYVVYDDGKEFTEKTIYIKALSNKKIVQTSTYYSDSHGVSPPVGFRHTLFLTEGGEVFGCGYNKFGQYGNKSALTEISLFSSQKIPFPPKIRIQQVLAQDNVSIFVTKGGRVFACGAIGAVINRQPCYEPTEIFLLENENVKIRSVTRDWGFRNPSILCLTDTGYVHVIRLGRCSLLHPIEREQLKFPPNVRIKKIQSGGNRSVFLKSTNGDWRCTMNRKEGRFNNTWDDSVSPEKLSSLLFNAHIQHPKLIPAFRICNGEQRKIEIVDIYPGFKNVFVVTSEGRVYACGNNKRGQLGIKWRKNHINFKLVSNIKVKPSTYKSNGLNNKLKDTRSTRGLYNRRARANQIAMTPYATFFVSKEEGKLLASGLYSRTAFKEEGYNPGIAVKLTILRLKELEKKFIRSIYCIGNDYNASLFVQTQSDEIYVVLNVGAKSSKGASFLPALSYKGIVQISGYDHRAKNNHILCLTQNDGVFIYWYNKFGQDGGNENGSPTIPLNSLQKIFFPSGIRVKEVLAEPNGVSIFVTEGGRVFACEEINAPSDHNNSLREVFLLRTKISSVTLDQGNTNILCLTETGNVYIIELTTHWLRDLDIKPRQLKFPQNTCIKEIRPAIGSVFFKSTNDEWYCTMGPQELNISNEPANHGALFSLSFESHFPQPRRIPEFCIRRCERVKMDIVDVYPGHGRVFAVTSKGDVYACGHNDKGQLGINGCNAEHINFKLVSNIKVEPSTWKIKNELGESLNDIRKKGSLQQLGQSRKRKCDTGFIDCEIKTGI